MPTRRRFLELGGLSTLLAMLPPGALALAAAPAPGSRGALELPPAAMRPRLRWWWCGAWASPAQVTAEVEAIADAGFGGFEIADVRDGLKVPMDPKIYGWGSPRWVALVEKALETAARRGLQADITLGAHWPTGMPGVIPDDPAAAQELVHGAVVLEAGQAFDGPLPPALAEPSGLRQSGQQRVKITPRCLALLAYRQLGVDAHGTVLLDPASRIELTAQARDGRLQWSAPAIGRWHLLAFWTRGTGQIQNMFGPRTATSMLSDPTPYVVDIFGTAGAKACIDYWQAHLLPPRTRELLRRIGGNFFEDSLELAAVRHWSPRLADEFERRRGYPLADGLPLLAVTPQTRLRMPFEAGPPVVPPFALLGIDSAAFVQDFERTLGEMYVDNRIRPLQAWAQSLGMGLRVQCIGANIDTALAAAVAGVPEGDNSCNLDGFRVLAAGRDLGGRRLLSDEAATFVGGQGYVADWKLLVFMVQRDFAGGVNQLVLHGFSSTAAPDAKWPGYSAFGRAIGNDWGPRSPDWIVASDISAGLARIQQFLQRGRNRADVAILHQAGGVAVEPAPAALARAGYLYQFPSPALLQAASATVRDGCLAAEGPGYRALLLNDEPALDLAMAQRLLDYARAGLPIVFVGRRPQQLRGLRQSPDELAWLRQCLAELSAQPNVVQVASLEAAVPALRRLGVAPSLQASRPSRLTAVRRSDGARDGYYLLNDADAPIALEVTLAGAGRPYRLDPWSGAIEPLAVFEQVPGGVRLPLRLEGSESRLIVLAEAGFAGPAPARHVVAGDGDWRYLGDQLRLCAMQPGRSRVRLDDGSEVEAELVGLPRVPTELAWTLELEEWLPAADPGVSRHRSHSLRLEQLQPWLQLPGLEQASGIGRYATEIELGSDWQGENGLCLELGEVGGSVQLHWDGKPVALDPTGTRIDLGRVAPGRHRLQVLVATNLNNRLLGEGINSDFALPVQAGAAPADPAPDPALAAARDPLLPPTGRRFGAPVVKPGLLLSQPGAGDPGGQRTAQRYGLIGPLRLLPYRLLAPVPAGRS